MSMPVQVVEMPETADDEAAAPTERESAEPLAEVKSTSAAAAAASPARALGKSEEQRVLEKYTKLAMLSVEYAMACSFSIARLIIRSPV
jgi:hypothetical protein